MQEHGHTTKQVAERHDSFFLGPQAPVQEASLLQRRTFELQIHITTQNSIF